AECDARLRVRVGRLEDGRAVYAEDDFRVRRRVKEIRCTTEQRLLLVDDAGLVVAAAGVRERPEEPFARAYDADRGTTVTAREATLDFRDRCALEEERL